VPQLAGLLGPALFRFAQKLGLALWATAIHPSAKKGGPRPQKRPGRRNCGWPRFKIWFAGSFF